MASFKIHPAIGVARVGNSLEYNLAPDSIGGLPLDGQGQPTTAFRDAERKLKRQGAGFSIYVYDADNPDGRKLQVGDPVSTASGAATVTAIEWIVHLANKKAVWYEFQHLTGSEPGGYQAGHKLRNAHQSDRQSLILDAGARTLSGPDQQAEFDLPGPSVRDPFEIDTLGDVRTDANGNLIVLGGYGKSGSTILPPKVGDYANNDGWHDDTADGPVSATLVMSDGSRSDALSAWVLVGPPAFAPQILNMVTLYDVIYDVFVRNFGYNKNLFHNGAFNSKYSPNYETEIRPILARPDIYQWVINLPNAKDAHAELLKLSGSDFPMASVRKPDQPNENDLMPLLWADNPYEQEGELSTFLTLTQTQYQLLSNWNADVTTGNGTSVPPLGPGEAIDEASLANCVGGAFDPGIEMSWICRNTTVYMPFSPLSRPSDAFRLRHKTVTGPLSATYGSDGDYSNGLEPGDITKYMAVPWQADFNECSDVPIAGINASWWPAQRPISVRGEGSTGSAVRWADPIPEETKGDLQMVSDWNQLGFVVDQAGQYVEVQRTLSGPRKPA